MLTDYEAAMLAKQKVTGGKHIPGRNRIGAVLLALSILSAVGLLYSAFFHRGHVSSATRSVPSASVATPIIHPATSGLPEASLFLRHRPLEGDGRASEAVRTMAELAASTR